MAQLAVMAPYMMAAGAMVSYMGSMQAAEAAKRAGQSRRAEAEFEAAQLQQFSGTASAAGQREGLEQERQSRLMQSRILAISASSGGSASDPTVAKLIADTAGNGAYRESVALYQGEEKARQLRLQAFGKRVEGSIAEAGGNAESRGRQTMAYGSLVQGGSTLFTKYGGRPPTAGIASEADLLADGRSPV